MSKYNQQYYILFPPAGDDQIYLKPSNMTAKRKYHYQKLVPGAPLEFEHAYRTEDQNKWPITNVLVDSSGMLVAPEFKKEIEQYPIRGLQIYPSVYVDDEGTKFEEYWYVGLYTELNCLDSDKSDVAEFDFDEEDLDEDDDIDAEVYRYSLDEKVLDQIPEEERLIFKMGGCSDKYVFVHKKIVDAFDKLNAKGVRFIKVADFEEGVQHS